MATPESCPRAAVVAFTGQFGTAEKSDPGRAFPSRPNNRTGCRKIAASNPFCIGIWTPVLRIRIRQIRMFLGLMDPDPLVRCTEMDLDPSIIKQK
jgi:hypothetical protein